MELNAKNVLTLPLPKKLTRKNKKPVTDHYYADKKVPALRVRVRSPIKPGDDLRRTYYVYRDSGFTVIDDVRNIKLEAARQRVNLDLGQVALGKDPKAERKKDKDAAKETLSKTVTDYLKEVVTELRPRSYAEAKRQLEEQWKPLHSLPLISIDRTAVSNQLNVIAKKGPAAANRARANLSAMFAWAIGEGRGGGALQNPVIGTNKKAENEPRERVLTDGEAATIWLATEKMEAQFGQIIRLLMLTGCRRDEIGSLRWSEVDLKERTIDLPGSRTKNHQRHIVPLTDGAVAILKSVPRQEGRDFVFGYGAGGYSGWQNSKQMLDKKAPLADTWRIHDLRRTAATRMADLGTQPHIIEAVLNHVSGHKSGVAGVYNRSAYEPEKRIALEQWAQHLAVAVAKATGANVTKLKKRK